MDEEDEKAIRRIIEIEDLIAFRKNAGAVERNIWIAASRQIFQPGERHPCWVCGKFKSVAQAHHVIPLAAQYDRGFKYPDQEFVWLCPNHHAMTHLYIPDDNRSMNIAAMRTRGRTTGALNSDLSEDEFNKLLDLMGRSMRSPE